jgi:hypothetical protein
MTLRDPGPSIIGPDMLQQVHQLSLTTQGPTYPPSEVMDREGRFIVIGRINEAGADGVTRSEWGSALVGADSECPPFGQQRPYQILRPLRSEDDDLVLHTLPLPLPCNNYPLVFAPEQRPDAHQVRRGSLPFHVAHVPDYRAEDGRRLNAPITLGQWRKAAGELTIRLSEDRRSASFSFEFEGMIPDTLYTIMSLRERDLDPQGPTRPGPLGIPNVFITDDAGRARYRAVLPNPFPSGNDRSSNRVVNVIVLWMSSQMSYGGAIGYYGLGGDIHAQLKLRAPIRDLTTRG